MSYDTRERTGFTKLRIRASCAYSGFNPTIITYLCDRRSSGGVEREEGDGLALHLWFPGPRRPQHGKCCKQNRRRNQFWPNVQADGIQDKKGKQCDAQDNSQRAFCECSVHFLIRLPQTPTLRIRLQPWRGSGSWPSPPHPPRFPGRANFKEGERRGAITKRLRGPP
jgi:hypothetical protein